MKKGFAFWMLSLCSFSIHAQDNYFTKYNASKINTNPAFAGSDSTLVFSNACLMYSYQWSLKKNSYQFETPELHLNFFIRHHKTTRVRSLRLI